MQWSSTKRQWVGGVLAGILLLSGLGVQAEEKTEIKIYEEEAVVVTATRTKQEESKAPGKTKVISKEEMASSGATTVGEALKNEGLTISTYGGTAGQANIQLGGASASQTLVLVNGIPANTGCVGEVDLSYMPTAGITRIEVTNGPLSALYGANALGGVVNIITDLTGEARNQVALSTGSFDYGNLALAVQQPKWGLAMGGKMSDGYRTHSATDSTFFKGQYDLMRSPKNDLTLNWVYTEKNNQDPGSTSWPSDYQEAAKNFSMDLAGIHKLNLFNVEYKTFVQSLTNRYFNDTYGDRHHTESIGTDIAANFASGNHEFVGGMMLRQDNYDSTASGQHQSSTGALFVQDLWNFRKRWSVTSGLRKDTGSDFSSPLCPRISLTFNPTTETALKLGYGKAFRAPTNHDLYYDNGGNKGNPDLKPETGDRVELIGEWKTNTQLVDLQLFHSVVKDGIKWVEQTDGSYQVENISKWEINGVELNWRNQWNPLFSTTFNYTRTDKNAWDSSNGRFSLSGNLFGVNQCSVKMEFTRGAWSSQIDWKYVTERSDYNYSKKNTDIFPDYGVFNTIFAYKVNSQLNYTLSINNIFGKEYEIHKGYPMPGREYNLCASYTF